MELNLNGSSQLVQVIEYDHSELKIILHEVPDFNGDQHVVLLYVCNIEIVEPPIYWKSLMSGSVKYLILPLSHSYRSWLWPGISYLYSRFLASNGKHVLGRKLCASDRQ